MPKNKQIYRYITNCLNPKLKTNATPVARILPNISYKPNHSTQINNMVISMSNPPKLTRQRSVPSLRREYVLEQKMNFLAKRKFHNVAMMKLIKPARR